MNTAKVSAFTLERYRLGELSPADQDTVRDALAGDERLQARLNSLEESDREFRLRYPVTMLPEIAREKSAGIRPTPQWRKPRVLFMGIGFAALIAAGIIVPVRNSMTGPAALGIAPSAGIDRAKGYIPAEAELALYLMGDRETLLADQAELHAGNTVQLAYTAPQGAAYYGVIFSIDGRSQLTMHYPYRAGQSSLLVSGKRTFLSEAYILDDAPDYEIFVMVISTEPLDAPTVLHQARELTEHNNVMNDLAAVNSRAVFPNCKVETITIRKR